MIGPRSYSKCGRARFQTEVQIQGPLLPITVTHSSQGDTWVLVQTTGQMVVHPTRQTMEEEEQASLEKDNKLSFGCAEFEYLWDVVRRCPVAVADISVTCVEETGGYTQPRGNSI